MEAAVEQSAAKTFVNANRNNTQQIVAREWVIVCRGDTQLCSKETRRALVHRIHTKGDRHWFIIAAEKHAHVHMANVGEASAL